jgi:hypothetical protein
MRSAQIKSIEVYICLSDVDFLYGLCSGISKKLPVIDFDQLTVIQEFYLDEALLSYLISMLRGGLGNPKLTRDGCPLGTLNCCH